ncbi:MAG: hypothetical protein J6X44_05580 [Thermoguttaceae bacterium]|nr:hypothetical protein [Thermoguttaceae bacterium]
MLIVNHFPQRFKDFFRQFAEKLEIDANICNYLWRIVLALACLEGRVSLKKISAFTGKWRTRPHKNSEKNLSKIFARRLEKDAANRYNERRGRDAASVHIRLLFEG